MKFFTTVLASLLLSLPVLARNSQTSAFSVDVSSAKRYLDMAQKAMNGTLPTEAEWDSLFVSPAYKELFTKVRWNKNEFETNVREAFEIAYNPAKEAVRDSIAATLDGIELANIDSELPFFVSTALSVKNKLQDYSDIINTLNIDDLISEANSRAVALLPNKGEGLQPDSCSIYFIVWDLECRALGDALFLDVNTFFHDGREAAINALGHEMHHFYLSKVFDAVYKEDIIDCAVLPLVNNMREGVADLINKKEMPLKSLTPYGRQMLEIYNADYENSPQVLAQLDTITCDYLDGKFDVEQYFEKAVECCHFEGHTTGSYMVFLIRDQLGLDAVIESVGDLDAFIDNYNKAAGKAGTYQFSDRFVKHIHGVSRPAKR